GSTPAGGSSVSSNSRYFPLARSSRELDGFRRLLMSLPEPQPERPETGSDVGQVLRGSEAPRLDASPFVGVKGGGFHPRLGKPVFFFFAHKLIPRPPPRQPGAQAGGSGRTKGLCRRVRIE